MQLISQAELDTSLPHRIQYLRDFISFTAEDAATLHAAAPVVSPLVPIVVNAVYDKLLSFDVTAKAFVPRQTGYSGATPTKLEDLNQEHPQIKFRKDFLARYLVKLMSMDYEKEESWKYPGQCRANAYWRSRGFKHREKKPALRVEFMHCAILLGYVEDILIEATKLVVTRAVNKILWIQNDLFARHYLPSASSSSIDSSTVTISKPLAVTAAAGLLVLGSFLQRVLPLHSCLSFADVDIVQQDKSWVLVPARTMSNHQRVQGSY
ncbi:Protoglobin-domain-containing protein [Coprinopsis sp. MPI-PUGE-AT-0042]|nr:Protoglobin-domain-containing protein [Coprinopsis sp. MPI-PUGE-AT-0042]